MSQEGLPLKSGAVTSPASPKGSEILNRKSPESAYPQYFSPSGPHSALRGELMWVQKLLAFDQNGSVSVISLRGLSAALSAFQKDLRVQVRGQLPLPVFTAADTVSRSPEDSLIPSGRKMPRYPKKNRNYKF